MFKKILNNRNFLTIFLTFFIFWVIFILSFLNIFYSFDKQYQDLTYKIIDSNVSKDLIIVEIDDKTLKKLWYPMDRKVYVPFIENLTKAWVPVIGFDIIFADKSNLPDSDIEFNNALKKSNNVIFGLSVDSNWFLEEPYSLFKNNIISSGYLSANIDVKTDVIYSIVPMSYFNNNQKQAEQFSISILKSYYSYIYWKDYSNIYWINGNDYYITPDIKIPLSRTWLNDYSFWKNTEKEILINYINREKFTKFSFLDIYNTNTFEELKKDIDFSNKIVIIGFTAKWIKDVFDTPNWKEFWVYTHANMINTVLTKSFLMYFDKTFEWILVLLLIVVSVYFNLSRSWFILLLSNLLIVFVFIILFPLLVLVSTNLIINYPIELIFALIFSLAITNIVKYIIENKDKIKLNKALSEYVSRDIAHEILSWEWKINLNWEEKKISIFFSDIEWFTNISEKLKPAELVWFLRIYLSKMSDIIIDESWFINKYEWDSIMALWWVFKDYDNDSLKSCLSAIKQQRLLRKLNKEWIKVWFWEVKVRIWIHTWEAIIWNIWSEWKKLEFTALWDSVNLASRLEWVNKFYYTTVCVSEVVYIEAKEKFDFRYLDIIKVKWKDIWIKIYELIEEKWKSTLKQLDIAKRFEEWTNFYLNGQFEKALEIFSLLQEHWDKPSLTYIDRCKMYIKNSPWDDWDWIWRMKEK